MALDETAKLELIEARRGPLENEQYAAELDLKTAEESKDEALRDEPAKRLNEINRKLKVLEEEEEKAKGEK